MLTLFVANNSLKFQKLPVTTSFSWCPGIDISWLPHHFSWCLRNCIKRMTLSTNYHPDPSFNVGYIHCTLAEAWWKSLWIFENHRPNANCCPNWDVRVDSKPVHILRNFSGPKFFLKSDTPWKNIYPIDEISEPYTYRFLHCSFSSTPSIFQQGINCHATFLH